jgi:hypothetical protein
MKDTALSENGRGAAWHVWIMSSLNTYQLLYVYSEYILMMDSKHARNMLRLTDEINWRRIVDVVGFHYREYQDAWWAKQKKVINSAARCDNFSSDLMTGYVHVTFKVCNMHSNLNWVSYLTGERRRHFNDESRGSSNVPPSVWRDSEASFIQRCRPDSSVCTFAYWGGESFQTKAFAKVEDWSHCKRSVLCNNPLNCWYHLALTVNDWMSVKHLQSKARVYWEEPAPLPLLPYRILHGLVLDQTRACMIASVD